MNTLEIKGSYFEEKENEVVVHFLLNVAGENKDLWYSVNKVYKKYLCHERADAVVVAFLHYAAMYKLNINSALPMSRKLHFQLNELLSILCETSRNKDEIPCISAPLTDEIYENEGAVGMGMSCGVDSFATLRKYSNDNCDEKYKVTHCTYYNVGAHHGSIGSYNGGIAQRELFNKQKVYAQKFCAEYDYPLIEVDSNVTDLQCVKFLYVHTYRNLSTTLLFQKLFSVYYYSSAYSVTQFRLNPSNDSGSYDILLTSMFSTETLSFYSSCSTMSRIEKVGMLVNFPPAQKYLHVCRKTENNCGICGKCMRTQLEIYSFGKMELFSESFDINKFYKNKHRMFRYLVKARKKDWLIREVYDSFKEKGIKIPLIDVFGAVISNVRNYIQLKNNRKR